MLFLLEEEEKATHRQINRNVTFSFVIWSTKKEKVWEAVVSRPEAAIRKKLELLLTQNEVMKDTNAWQICPLHPLKHLKMLRNILQSEHF